MRKWLAVSDAAERLGVSSSTFKRWCKRHDVVLERTPGGHRRISESVLEQLIQEIGISKHSRNSGRNVATILSTENILQLLKSRRAAELRDVVLEACAESSDIVSIIDHSLAPAMWQVGTLWQRGDLQVYEEKMCTETMSQAIDLLVPFIRKDVSAKVDAIGGSMHQGFDTIASKFVSLSLNSIGVSAYDLGPCVPADELAAAANSLDVRVVWSTHTHWDDRSDVIAQHVELRRLLPRDTYIFVGGGGLSLSARHALDFCSFFETLADMAAFTEQNVLRADSKNEDERVRHSMAKSQAMAVKQGN